MAKFKNKYRIESTRLQNWDYGWDASYFITICTQERKCYFGDVENGKMNLSPLGVIANILWHEIKNHAKNIELDAFVVMPNHIHGILILDGNDGDIGDNCNDDGNGNRDGNVETTHALSLQSPTKQSSSTQQTIGQQRFQNQGKNTISSIVGGYKSAVTKHAHRLGFEFAWHPRFYDHIIRNDESFHRIKQYIINNPAKWDDDKFYND